MADATIDDIFGAAHEQSASVELSKITRLVDEAADYENQIQMAEEVLARLKENHFKILTRDIPEAMAEAGTESITTKSGLTVKVGTHVSGSIGDKQTAPEVRQARIDYVASVGGDGIITADTVLKFGRSNRNAAIEVARSFEGRDDCAVEVREDIHHSTLKAWARERIEKNLPLEPERAGLWVGRIAKIEQPKKAKG